MSDEVADRPHPSRARRVLLFEDRAEVVRGATVPLAAGTRWIALDGVSPLVDDRSVQARTAAPGVQVLAARVVRRVHQVAALGREEIEALEREEQEARARAEAAWQTVERTERSLARMGQMEARWARAIGTVPRHVSAPSATESWRQAWDTLQDECAGILARAAKARAEAERADEDRERAAQRLAQGLVRRPRWEAVIEIQLATPAAVDADVEAIYRVPCALWRPEHLARLTVEGADARQGAVEIVTYATAWQRTGETWQDVEARFSTARPARAATPPPVEDDLLRLRKKTEEEKREVVVQAHEQAVQLAGIDRGTRQVDEMPGVDDGGAPLEFTARAGRVTLPSDGRPFRVEVARSRGMATVERVLFPERAPVAHLRATLTHAGAAPLLAGPVRLARGAGLVGRSRLDFVGVGEPFELGFGPEDGVRVRRKSYDERDTTMLVGTQKLRRTVEVHLSNLSDARREILVTERIPVSEIEDVKVTVADAPGWKHDARNGILRLEVALAPHETRTLKLAWELKAGAKVKLPF